KFAVITSVSYCSDESRISGIQTSKMLSLPNKRHFSHSAQTVASKTMPQIKNDSVRVLQPKNGSTKYSTMAPSPCRCGPCCQRNISHNECFWKRVASLKSHWSMKKIFTA